MSSTPALEWGPANSRLQESGLGLGQEWAQYFAHSPLTPGTPEGNENPTTSMRLEEICFFVFRVPLSVAIGSRQTPTLYSLDPALTPEGAITADRGGQVLGLP